MLPDLLIIKTLTNRKSAWLHWEHHATRLTKTLTNRKLAWLHWEHHVYQIN